MSEDRICIYLSYNTALNSRNNSITARTFAASQSLLAATAMISKLLWPLPQPRTHVNGTPLSAKEKREATVRANLRGEVLRYELGEEELSALTILQSREARNGLEHFDERLDQYLFEAGDNMIIDRNIMSPNSIVIDGREPLSLRNINPQNHTISVLGDEANMQNIVAAVDQLKILCTRRLQGTA
jgi:hypothetical protein